MGISQIKSDLHEIFRVYFFGCPKMIKIKKNKSINKQTNNKTNKHFLDPKYLSQIKSNLHKIFRGTFCWCPKKIKKNKSINKQTNKQTNKKFRTYISQPTQVISSQTFQGIFLWVSQYE